MVLVALTATFTVDPCRGLTSISPLIYGQFLEHFHRQVYGGVFEPGSPLADGRGFRLGVIEALRDLRVPVTGLAANFSPMPRIAPL